MTMVTCNQFGEGPEPLKWGLPIYQGVKVSALMTMVFAWCASWIIMCNFPVRTCVETRLEALLVHKEWPSKLSGSRLLSIVRRTVHGGLPNWWRFNAIMSVWKDYKIERRVWNVKWRTILVLVALCVMVKKPNDEHNLRSAKVIKEQ